METDRNKLLHFNAIDRMKAYACIGIIAMHVLANGNYLIPENWFSEFFFKQLIPSFTDFVFLFMIISAFGMCCGYYTKVVRGQLDPVSFYRKRYAKIWPFFTALCILDVLISPSREAVYELFANITLCFGLLPNANISVIGVGWFIGVIFVFYMLFPFFCCLISTKKRAWISFGGAVIFHYICRVYFFKTSHVTDGFTARTNFVYCAIFFFAGGLIYLYKDILAKSNRYKWIAIIGCISGTIIYFQVSNSTYTLLLLFSSCLIYGIGREGKENRFVKNISNISMEMYLCHMVIFRLIEKAGLIHLFSSEILSYVIVTAATVLGAIGFSIIGKRGIKAVKLLCMKMNMQKH